MGTNPIPLAQGDYFRSVSKEARIVLRNRFFEQNPVLTSDQVGLIARPGERKAVDVGSGPIRQNYCCPGTFSEDLFTVSGLFLYRISCRDFTVTNIGQIGSVETDSVVMAATQNIGTTPGHLFVADGGVLWCYTEDGYAFGRLQATGVVNNGDTVTTGTTYYKFTNASVDAGTPAGTLANPWLVELGIDAATSLDNLYQAMNLTGTAGTTYSTAITPNPSVTAYSLTTDTLYVRAIAPGLIGNGVATTETGANLNWASGTLLHGGEPGMFQVPTPDDVGIISLAFINNYVVLVPVQGAGINGRFFWINPGETTIDPLNYATAERAPDAVYQVLVFSDQFWLLGQTTVETWYMTGNSDAPVIRTQGVVFDRGTTAGTGIQANGSIILVDPNGAVFQISNGVTPISTPDIANQIREAIKLAAT